jgi:hypothetical protein
MPCRLQPFASSSGTAAWQLSGWRGSAAGHQQAGSCRASLAASQNLLALASKRLLRLRRDSVVVEFAGDPRAVQGDRLVVTVSLAPFAGRDCTRISFCILNG